MATLIASIPASFDKECQIDPKEFERNRIPIPYEKDNSEDRKFKKGKKRFKNEVIDVLCPPSKKASKTDLKLGQFHIFKISEIKALIEMSPEADYIHIYNSLNDDNYNMMYAIPHNSLSKTKENEASSKDIITGTSLLISSFPCPPDPRCPKP